MYYRKKILSMPRIGVAFIMCSFRAPSVDGYRVKWQCDYDI